MLDKRSYPSTYELQDLDNEPLFTSIYAEDASDHGKTTSSRMESSWRSRFSGWRGGVAASIAGASLVLLLNVILAIVAAARWHPIDGIATAFTGDCTLAARWTTAAHLVINLLSSLLLGASNYCMQRLVAPTRKEIDEAHAKKKWLDIGIPSIRNLNAISTRRLVTWLLLALSSMPLHFLYNSIIFETIGATVVSFDVVKEEFFTDKDSWELDSHFVEWQKQIRERQNTLLNGKYLDRSVFENLTDAECKSRYDAPFIDSGAGFGVPIRLDWQGSIQVPTNLSFRDSFYGSGSLNLDALDKDLNFSYCLSKKGTPRSCSIQLSQPILYIVIACNVLKIGLMIFILWRLNQETIVTIGDALTSFLRTPDSTTRNCCLMSKRTVDRLWKAPEVQVAQRFKQTREACWGIACSKTRWGISLFLYFGAITTTGILMGYISKSVGFPRDGFGKVSTDYIIDIALPYGNISVLPHILLANFPQAFISLIYLVYNGQFTIMLAHREWSNYVVKRAPLRVTIPSRGQRSTYFLQLPYVFSVPLLFASIILHWFISQSIFLVRIVTYEDGNTIHMSIVRDQDGDIFNGVGYSNAAIIASISWGSVLVVACLAVALFGRYPVGLPIGGMNSAVISAACHIEHQESESMVDRPIKWGVTVPGNKETVGHCSFSSGETGMPEFGHLYAGCIARTGIALRG